MSNVRMRGSEDHLLDLADRAAERLEAQPKRPARAVIFETLRDGLAKAGRRGRAGERAFLALYYGVLQATRASTIVHQARRQLWGSEAPPFRSWPEAEAWLLAQADLRPEQAPTVTDKARTALQNSNLPVDWESLQPLILVYGSPDGSRGGFCCFTAHSLLTKLRKWVNKLMRLTGWWEEAALAHVLIGAIPASTPVVSVPEGDPTHLEVTLWPWHLSALPALTDMITSSLPDRENKILEKIMRWPIHVLDAQLLLLMELEAYPPQSAGRGHRTGQTPYWTRLAQAWREIYHQRARPEALRKRWERMRKKGDLPDSLRQEDITKA